MSNHIIDDLTSILGKGHENAIPSPIIAQALNISGRALRQLVKEARRQGVPILATCNQGGGLFLPGSAEEYEDYIKMLGERSRDMYITRAAIIKSYKKYLEEKEKEEA